MRRSQLNSISVGCGFCISIPEPKLIALQKDKKELLTIDEFKPFSVIRSNQHSVT